MTKIEANDVLSAGATTTATAWLLFVPLPSLPVVHSLIERRTRIFFKSELPIRPKQSLQETGSGGMQEWGGTGARARAAARAGHLVPMTTERLAELPPVGFKIFAEEGV